MNQLLNRMREMAGLEPIVETVVAQPEAEVIVDTVEEVVVVVEAEDLVSEGDVELTAEQIVSLIINEKKIGDEDEDDEDSDEAKVKRLTDRYRRGNKTRGTDAEGDKDKLKADQDDAFKGLTHLLGGADKAAKHIMAANEGVEVVEIPLAEKLETVDSNGGGATAANTDAKNGDSPPKDTKEGLTKVEVPADVTAAISKRIVELKTAIAKYDDKGYNDDSSKQKAVECLEKIQSDLAQKDEDGFAAAQIYIGTLMSPITNLFPPKVIKFLSNNAVVKQGDGKLKTVKEAQSRNGIDYLSGRCYKCGTHLDVPLVASERGAASELQQGFKCDICDAVDSWVDGDDYAQYHAKPKSARSIERPTRPEDRPGSGYERFSDDTAERDGIQYPDDER